MLWLPAVHGLLTPAWPGVPLEARGSSTHTPAPPAARHPAHAPQPFFCQHDILLAAGPQTEEEEEALVEGILGAAGGR